MLIEYCKLGTINFKSYAYTYVATIGKTTLKEETALVTAASDETPAAESTARSLTGRHPRRRQLRGSTVRRVLWTDNPRGRNAIINVSKEVSEVTRSMPVKSQLKIKKSKSE